jgi:hypothetical protein
VVRTRQTLEDFVKGLVDAMVRQSRHP